MSLLTQFKQATKMSYKGNIEITWSKCSDIQNIFIEES